MTVGVRLLHHSNHEPLLTEGHFDNIRSISLTFFQVLCTAIENYAYRSLVGWKFSSARLTVQYSKSSLLPPLPLLFLTTSVYLKRFGRVYHLPPIPQSPFLLRWYCRLIDSFSPCTTRVISSLSVFC